LIDHLNRGLHRKLTLMVAPAGFGKTTLLSDALRNAQTPVAWLSVDEDDNDPVHFWTYFIAALQAAQPGISEAALVALQSPQPLPIESILTTLINEIAEKQTTLTFVLDDYHVIESRSVHNALVFLLEHMPPQMHLVITSRIDPPLRLNRLRGRGQLTELRAADLRFTSEEVAAFLNDAMGLNLSKEHVAALESRTEGWIASLQMAAHSMRGQNDIPTFIASFAGDSRYLLDYLTEEVLHRQPVATQSFLLETAILDHLTGALCDAVTGRDDGQQILGQLETANLFVVPLDDERHWYRHHPLITDLLRSQLTRSHPHRLPVLHQRASEWFEQEGRAIEAVNHALAAGDFERGARLIETISYTMVREHRLSLLLGWLGRLPKEMIAASPSLCVSHAWASFLTGQLDAVEPLLQSAEQELPEDTGSLSPDILRENARIRSHVITLRAFMARVRGDTARTIELSHEAFRHIPEDELPLLSRLAVNLGYAYLSSGELAAADHYLGEAKRIAEASGNLYVGLQATSHLADLQTKQGHLRQAAKIYRQALQLSAEGGSGQPLPSTGYAHVGLGEVLYEWDLLDEANHRLTEGIDLAKNARSWMIALRGHLSLARLKQAQGQPEEAMETLRQAERVAPEAAIATESANVPIWRARLSLAQGNLDAANSWSVLQESRTSLHEVPHSKFELAFFTLARVHIAQGRAQEIPALLQRWRQLAEVQGRQASVIEILMLQALALETLNNEDKAVATLARALSLAEPEGHIRIFVDEGKPMLRLIQRALSQPDTPAYASRLLASFRGSAHQPRDLQTELPLFASPDLPPLSLVEHLSERERDMLRLIAAGLSNQQIADELYLSINTVKTHTKSLYGKLNVHSRIQTAQRARELGLLRDQPLGSSSSSPSH
jgi:LuxR family maltose regulon positive regulatory protein